MSDVLIRGDDDPPFDFRGVGASVTVAKADGQRSFVQVQARHDAGRLIVQATVFAEARDGQRIMPSRPHIEIGMWRSGVRAIWKRYSGPSLPSDPGEEMALLQAYTLKAQDIEDAVNQMVGRDAEQESPPELSWGPLIMALRAQGVAVTEEKLLSMPFRFEFTEELIAEICANDKNEA